MLLIGSRALAFRAPAILNRPPKDFDFVCTKEEFDSWLSENAGKVNVDPSNPSQVYPVGDSKMVVHGDVPCEFEIVRPGTSSEMLYNIVKHDKDTLHTKFGSIPNLDMLFTLKKSHRYLKDSPHFWKNLADYHKMKMLGAKVRGEYSDFLRLREKETYQHKHPKLNVSKKDFFNPDSGVRYVYDHDSIHVAVKHLELPAYRYFMKDEAEVACDKEKFFNCSREIQLLSVLEESYVLAIERSQVPFPGKVKPEASFRIAISKVCTSISSGWWREFAYENCIDVLKMYSDTFMDKFNAGLEAGIVKPFSGDNNPYK